MVLVFVACAGRALAQTNAASGTAGETNNLAVSATQLKGLSLEDLMNIEVTTVQRHESTVSQSTAAITVITQEDIRRSGANEIPELFRRVPGMSVARIDNNKWAVSARGFNERFYGKMLVQIDGRTLYNPSNAGVYWDAVDYPLEDIERIEIIRGPHASVWGANAVNGVINIITKSAKATQGGLFSGGGGNEEQGFGTFRYGDKIGENLFYRVYGKGFSRDSQFSTSGDPHDDWLGASGGFRLDWQPGDQNLVTFQGDFLHSDADRRDLRPQTAPPYFFTNIETEATANANLLGRWTHTISDDSTWILQAYWDYFRRRVENLQVDLNWDSYDVDFEHQLRLGTRQKLVWGAGYRLIDSFLSDSGRDNAFFLDWTDNRRNNQLFSVFLQDEITVVEDKLNFSLGAKLEHNDFTGFEAQPSARLLWTPNEKQSVWAAVSRAVRTPNLTETYALNRLVPASTNAPTFPQVTANANLHSETVLAYQLGYRVQATRNFSVDSAIFYAVYHDLLATLSAPTQPGPAGTITLPVVRQNGLDADTYGAEVSANWRPIEWWRLYGAYSFLEMQLHRYAGFSQSAEAPEGQSPQHQVYLQSSWDLPGNVEFDLIGRYVDQLSGFNPSGATGVADKIPAYMALDVRMAWRPQPNLELSVVGQNLLDNHHPEFGTSAAVRSPLVEIQRAVYGKITWSF